MPRSRSYTKDTVYHRSRPGVFIPYCEPADGPENGEAVYVYDDSATTCINCMIAIGRERRPVTKQTDPKLQAACGHPHWMDCGCPIRQDAERSAVIVATFQGMQQTLSEFREKTAARRNSQKYETFFLWKVKSQNLTRWCIVFILTLGLTLFGSLMVFRQNQKAELKRRAEHQEQIEGRNQENKIRLSDLPPDQRREAVQRLQQEQSRRRKEELELIKRRLEELEKLTDEQQPSN